MSVIVDLEKDTRSALEPEPMRLVVYGPPGVGKTYFACNAPNPYVIAFERGVAGTQAKYIVTKKEQSWTGKTEWDYANGILDALLKDTKYNTIIVDSLGWAQQAACDWILEDAKVKTIKFAYNGFEAWTGKLLELFREFIGKLEALRAKGKHIILLSHSEKRTFTPEIGAPYDRIELSLHGKIAGFITQWTDMLFYYRFNDTSKRVDERDKKGFGKTGRDRVMYTTHNALAEAKTRWRGFSEEMMNPSFDEFYSIFEKVSNVPYQCTKLRDEIRTLLANDPKRLASMEEKFKEIKDSQTRLDAVLVHLRRTLPPTTEEKSSS